MLPTTCKMERPELTVAQRRPPRSSEADGGPAMLRRRCVVLELIVISTLNGVLYGMLLFLMASGLTLIFSMMGVLNFAHASFYMLGAFFGFQISRWFGFWPALIIAPLLAGAIGAAVERYGLRHVHKQRPRRRAAVHLRPGLRDRGNRADHLGQEPGRLSACPPLLDFSGLHDLLDQLSRLQDVHAAGLDRRSSSVLLIVLKQTRIGLIVQAALTHPHMVAISATTSAASSCWCSASAPRSPRSPA